MMAFYAIIIVVSVLFGLTVSELFLRFTSAAPEIAAYSANRQLTTTSMNVVSGAGHISSDFHHTGAAPWEAIKYPEGYDIRTNKFGFFTDYPVDEFPAKAANEFRIVLLGGSGAQGHGGRTNADMFYKLLEKALNEDFSAQNIQVRVINLAMAGGQAVSNMMTMRAFAHPLKPDLILAYMGANDISQVLASKSFAGMMRKGRIIYERPATLSAPIENYPWYAVWAVKLFPMSLQKSGIAAYFESEPQVIEWQLNDDGVTAPARIRDSNQQVYDQLVIPGIVNSYKTIKREFCGIPVVMVRQMFSHPTDVNRFLASYGLDDYLHRPVYDDWWQKTEKALAGYMNDQWYFLDAHGWFGEHFDVQTRKLNWTDGKEYKLLQEPFGIHLTNDGHGYFTKWLEPQLREIISAAYPQSRQDPCEALYAPKS
jgi:lysophospholipase L1-like esterase